MLLTPSLACFALPLLFSRAEAASSSTGEAPTPTALLTTPTLPTPTASPLPPVSPFVEDLINKLVTASLYANLLANGGDYQATCDLIVPENISGVGSSGINGTAVKTEICTGASLVAINPDFGPFLRDFNRRGGGYLATALFAVRIAGNFAGGPDLATLCTEIEAELINLLFVGFTDTDVGSQVKDYICGAAAASSSSSAAASAACPTKIPTSNYDYTLP